MSSPLLLSPNQYNTILKDISGIYERALNEGNEDWNKAVLTSNWYIGKKIVEIIQKQVDRAKYGERGVGLSLCMYYPNRKREY